MAKVIFLNGPANSGKDTIADIMVEKYGYTKLSFKSVLFEFMFNIFNIKGDAKNTFMETYYTREAKELPCELLCVNGKSFTPREALIHVSENVIKPIMGEAFFGEYIVRNIKSDGRYVFSDCGFLAEILPIVKAVFPWNTYIMRLHREGCTFANDSRNYLYPQANDVKCVHEYDIDNNGELNNAICSIIELINSEKE